VPRIRNLSFADPLGEEGGGCLLRETDRETQGRKESTVKERKKLSGLSPEISVLPDIQVVKENCKGG